LALFGSGRFLFNLVGVRVFGPGILGVLNVGLSTWSLAAVLVATVPSVLAGKYVAEYSATNPVRAARVLGASLATAWMACGVGLALVALIAPAQLAEPWPYFGAAYSTYLVVRSAYFAHQESVEVFASELLAFAVFVVVFAVGVLLRSPMVCSLSLVLQPGTYVLRALWVLRDRIQFEGAYREMAHDTREYGGFSLATLGNAGASLTSYHLTVVLAGRWLATPADVGYLSVLLALMSPINLVPQALGPVLFSEFARRHGVQDVGGQQSLALRSTVLLQLFIVAAVGLASAFTEQCLRIAHLPPTTEIRGLWMWLTYTVGLTIVSAPCGHLLNATRHAGRQALASLSFATLGLAVGGLGMPRFGLPAAGWMRFAVDGCLAWTRMLVAATLLQFARKRWADLVGFQLFLAVILLLGLGDHGRMMKIAAVAIALLCLGALAHRELRQLQGALSTKAIRRSESHDE
jgi:O-antigen/teichoic acid export membrane protein